MYAPFSSRSGVVVSIYYFDEMAKEKVTLTLETESLKQLRKLCGERSLSASVDAAVRAHLARLRHLRAVDGWLDELEREHGPIPAPAIEWATAQIDEWEKLRTKRKRATG